MIDLTNELSVFDAERLRNVERAEVLGEFNFSDAIPKVESCLKVALALTEEDSAELPNGLEARAREFLKQLDQTLDGMENFSLSVSNPKQARDSLIAQVEAVRQAFATEIRPHVHGARIEVAATRTESENALADIRAAQEETERLLSGIRAAAGEAGASQLSSYYGHQARRHEAAAKQYMRVSASAVAGTAILAVVLFWSLGQAVEQDWASLVRDLVTRIFWLGLASYVVAFAVRNYRVNAHLQVVNEQKRNALDTYTLFSESAGSDEARELITAELVRAVFAGGDTGYLQDSATETTIVESNSSILPMLLRRG